MRHFWSVVPVAFIGAMSFHGCSDPVPPATATAVAINHAVSKFDSTDVPDEVTNEHIVKGDLLTVHNLIRWMEGQAQQVTTHDFAYPALFMQRLELSEPTKVVLTGVIEKERFRIEVPVNVPHLETLGMFVMMDERLSKSAETKPEACTGSAAVLPPVALKLSHKPNSAVLFSVEDLKKLVTEKSSGNGAEVSITMRKEVTTGADEAPVTTCSEVKLSSFYTAQLRNLVAAGESVMEVSRLSAQLGARAMVASIEEFHTKEESHEKEESDVKEAAGSTGTRGAPMNCISPAWPGPIGMLPYVHTPDFVELIAAVYGDFKLQRVKKEADEKLPSGKKEKPSKKKDKPSEKKEEPSEEEASVEYDTQLIKEALVSSVTLSRALHDIRAGDFPVMHLSAVIDALKKVAAETSEKAPLPEKIVIPVVGGTYEVVFTRRATRPEEE